MANKEPEIAPTVSFRHPSLGVTDKVIGEHRSGFVEQEVPRGIGDAYAILPPQPSCEAPKTSLSARLRQRLEREGK